MLQLSHAALLDVLEGIEPENPVPLMLACQQQYSQYPHPFPADFLEQLIAQTALAINPALSRLVHTGQSGILVALQMASACLEDTDTKSVLLGGVDSYQRAALLKGLLEEGRIKTAAVLDGYTPGEGTCFILLTCNKANAIKVDNGATVRIAAPGFSEEPGHRYSEEPYLGEGLANAVRQAVSSSKDGSIQNNYSSMNGEGFWPKELATEQTRNTAHFRDDDQLMHPADCYGDLAAGQWCNVNCAGG